jgi:hypothetical protein
MDTQTFDKVWYLCGDSFWRIFRLIAYQDVGTLTVSDTKLEFKGEKRTVVIEAILDVTYGKQGRDFVNNWVKVEYEIQGSRHKAFFADGGSLGWGGVLGGTKRMFEVVRQLPTIRGNVSA